MKTRKSQAGLSAVEVICGLLLIGGLAWKFFPLSSSEDADKKNAEMAVRQSLKDPDSAQFGEFTIGYTVTYGKVSEMHTCLTVNAKNSFGGYIGKQEAIVFERVFEGRGKWNLIKIIEGSHNACVKKLQSECIDISAGGNVAGYDTTCVLHSNSS